MSFYFIQPRVRGNVTSDTLEVSTGVPSLRIDVVFPWEAKEGTRPETFGSHPLFCDDGERGLVGPGVTPVDHGGPSVSQCTRGSQILYLPPLARRQAVHGVMSERLIPVSEDGARLGLSSRVRRVRTGEETRKRGLGKDTSQGRGLAVHDPSNLRSPSKTWGSEARGIRGLSS